MKKGNTYRGFYDHGNDSEFDHQFACWANNHNGWSKMRSANRRRAKRREKRKAEQNMTRYEDFGVIEDNSSE